ncbi:MAG: class II aldolase/adducin family protein [Bryobacteraceae bacterium]
MSAGEGSVDVSKRTEQELRQNVVEIGKLMYQKGWVAANDGNITVRLDPERILATPTGVSKGMMGASDLIVVDMDGNKISGCKAATSEINMHLAIYRLRPEIQSVVHAHPPVATGFAAAGRPLNLALLPEVVVGLGSIPLAGYGLPGTLALVEPMLPLIPKHDAIILQNHGVVCYSEDEYGAFFRMETVEHFARITLVAELLGGANALPRLEVEKLFASRERYGVRSKSRMEPGWPIVSEDLNGDRAPDFVTKRELFGLFEEFMKTRGLV